MLRSPRKRQNLREWLPSAVFDWFLLSGHSPSTAPQPWPCCGVSAFTPSLPIWLSLRSTSFMVLLTRNASARACRVGTRERPSGQQTCGRFTAAVVNYLLCQLVRMSRLSLVPTHVRSSRHHPAHSILHISSHLHGDLLPPFFHNENTFRNHIPPPERGWGSRRGGEPQNCWDLEVYK